MEAEPMQAHIIHRLRYRFLRVLIGCMLVLAVPAAVSAQDSTPTTPDLIVTVRDVSGAALPNLLVQIHAGADTPVLAQARTDAQGQVTFTGISVSQLRVRVSGTLVSGAHLYQPGADAQGIALFLGPPPTTLDLRVDTDGMVLPDPTTMIDPVPNGPAIASGAPGPDGNGRIVFPTSATYAPRVAPIAAAPGTAAPLTSALPTSPAPDSPSLLEWLLGSIAAIVFVGGGLLLIMFLGRRQA
jgi:hypothetical protein